MTRIRAALAASLVLLLGGSALGTAGAAEHEPDPEQRVTIVRSDGDRPTQAAATYARLMAIPSAETEYAPSFRVPRNPCPPRRCRDVTVPLPRGVKVTSSRVRVLLPRGYSDQRNKRVRYPVIYAYNGARSPYTRWSEATELVAITRDLPAIIVMPEGGRGDDAGMFSDWKDGSWDWETFHVDVLLPWVDRKFRTIRGARGTLGASMGGLGALIYPARHPDKFRAALSISGATDTNLMTGNILPPELAKALGISPPDLRRVWGNPVLHRRNWRAHNPTAQAAALKGIDLYIASGTGSASTESATGQLIHTGYTEQLMWTGHRTFLGALTAAGVGYHAYVWQGGVHDWPWLNSPLRWALPKMVRTLRRR